MKRLDNSGQTLIALLIFMLLAITITVAAASVTIVNLRTNDSFVNGEMALQAADSGAENALMQLERNPGFSGETLTINGSATATITISGTSASPIITSVGSVTGVGTFKRTVVVNATYSNNIYTVTSWTESP